MLLLCDMVTPTNVKTSLGSDLSRSPYTNEVVTFFGEVETSLPQNYFLFSMLHLSRGGADISLIQILCIKYRIWC